MSREKKDELRMTQEMLETFFQYLSDKGRNPVSIQNYQMILMGLYEEYLPDDKIINRNTASEWMKWMKEQGYQNRTICARMSVLNSFLQYLNRREWQMSNFHEKTEDVQPELTRAEYVRLLKAARLLGKEKAYLLIKTIGGAGVKMQELPQLTVEALQKDTVQIKGSGGKRILRIPRSLRGELLDYANREGVSKGPVFVARNGAPLVRSSVWYQVNSVCREAKVPDEKANPRCLWRMHQNTYAGIQANIASLVEQAYDRMMEEEQLKAGWKES